MLKDISFFKRYEPTEYTISGRQIRMLFSMRAAARIEDALGGSYGDILMEMLQIPASPEDPQPPPMRLHRQVAIVRILMQEAGEQITDDELLEMHMGDFAELARCAQMELALKSWSEQQAKKKESLSAEQISPSDGLK